MYRSCRWFNESFVFVKLLCIQSIVGSDLFINCGIQQNNIFFKYNYCLQNIYSFNKIILFPINNELIMHLLITKLKSWQNIYLCTIFTLFSMQNIWYFGYKIFEYTKYSSIQNIRVYKIYWIQNIRVYSTWYFSTIIFAFISQDDFI